MDWPKATRNDTNFHDIEIGDYSISWNLNGGDAFAISEESVHEAGCIHTSQGLEFDYTGVIIGDDLRYENGKVITDYTKRAKTDNSLKGIKTLAKKDKEKANQVADEIIKNTYRTLMTRGMKGCYVYCTDTALAQNLKRTVPGVESKETEITARRNMTYTSTYQSPLGGILLAADEIGLTGLWFEGQKYFANTLPKERISEETQVLAEAKKWLDLYFSGEKPDFTPPLHPAGSPFRQAVWKILLEIPYGQTTTYGEIAKQLAAMQNTSSMSAQAVGGAVGHNEVSIIIPCHRVVGTNGSLTGYAGGMDKKIALLELEHTNKNGFFVPKKGTAL